MAKPLKVRILKSTLNDGDITYTAQYRMMGTWFSFDDNYSSIRKEVSELLHNMFCNDDTPRPHSTWIVSSYGASSKDIEECKLLIKQYLDAVDVYNKNVASKTVKKTEVIKL